MPDIVEFLTARLDEDDRVAREATAKAAGGPVYGAPDLTGKWRATNDGIYADTAYTSSPFAIDGYGFLPDEIGAHIARHDPARVLAEVKAKRAIVQAHACVWLVDQWVEVAPGQRRRGELRVCRACEPVSGFMTDQWPCLTLKLLAAPYDQHPDYKQEWGVE
jgi:hypothetical protein